MGILMGIEGKERGKLYGMIVALKAHSILYLFTFIPKYPISFTFTYSLIYSIHTFTMLYMCHSHIVLYLI